MRLPVFGGKGLPISSDIPSRLFGWCRLTVNGRFRNLPLVKSSAPADPVIRDDLRPLRQLHRSHPIPHRSPPSNGRHVLPARKARRRPAREADTMSATKMQNTGAMVGKCVGIFSQCGVVVRRFAKSKCHFGYVFGHLEIRRPACPLALRQAPNRTGWAGLQGKGGHG